MIPRSIDNFLAVSIIINTQECISSYITKTTRLGKVNFLGVRQPRKTRFFVTKSPKSVSEEFPEKNLEIPG